MKILPTFEIITFDQIWEAAGPIIITLGILLISATICLIILQRMDRGISKELVRYLTIIGLVVITIFSFQITSQIWSL